MPRANDRDRARPSGGDSYRDLTAVPCFVRLVASSTGAKTGARMYQVLLVLFVLDTFHSPGLTGLVVLASQVPGIVMSPVAGALLDRRGRVVLMAVDYLVAGTSVALVMSLSLAHVLGRDGLFVIVALGSITQPLSATGSRALFPAIVPRHLWDRSNAVDATTNVLANVLGPAVGGLGVALLGARVALALPVALYLLGGTTLIGVRAPAPTAGREASLWQDAAGAVRYVFTNSVLRQLAMTMTVFNASQGVLTVVIPVYVLHDLHGGSKTAGVMIATLGLVAFFSSILAGARGTEGRERSLMVASSGGAALGLCLLALATHSEVLAFVALGLTSLANGPMQVTMFTLRQRATDPQWFGRAFAVSMNINASGMPLASGVVGLIVTHSIVWAFLFAAALAAFSSVWPLLFPFRLEEPGATLLVASVTPGLADS